MNGELAQVVALVTHGSSWLASPGGEPPRLDLGNITFRHVDAVAFDFADQAASGSGHAGDVASWLMQVAERGVDRLWLVVPDERRDQAVETGSGLRVLKENFLAGLANTGSWSLLATGEDRTESWRASWKTWTRPDGSRPDRVWRVQYVGQGIDASLPETERRPPTVAMADAQAKLLAAVVAARDFAHAINYEPWPARFEKAIAMADPFATPAPVGWLFPADGQSGCFPERGYSDESQRLLAMASQSWVFGGMGWWGDRIFQDKEVEAERDRLGDALYVALLQACAASVNAPLSA